MRRLMRPALILLLVALASPPRSLPTRLNTFTKKAGTRRLASTTKLPYDFFKQAYELKA